MTPCPACRLEPPEGSRYCPACGTPLTPDALEVTGLYRPEPATETPFVQDPASPSPPGRPGEQVRFAPGVTLLGRYRIVSAVGRGGMGEVYRADDLRLHQQVALKFLPHHLLDDPDRLARFHNEVQIARQVSHPRVCRVHDIAEVNGQAFLTMEFIDGEDLGSLLKRIGRLPEDKGVQIARQLCDGLAAAHEQGIVHRDLKPRNIMIDGSGQVRLTDFGLAAFADSVSPADARFGTPAYMAPEQLAGGPATVQSDLFALGLVLYEVFTGRRPFPARGRDELSRLYREHTPDSVSDLLPGMDPRVARVIRQCLEKDPARRPATALQVAAGLPQPDSLAAALARGQMPSPEMVANAGAEGILAPPVAGALLGAAVLGVLLIAFLAKWATFYGQVPLDQPPRALAARARTLLDRLGHTDQPLDTCESFFYNYAYLDYTVRNDSSPRRWAALPTGEPPAMAFWYRQSPQHLVATRMGLRVYPGRVTPVDPPLVPGMSSVFLDTRGHLLELLHVPARERAPGPLANVDWKPLFEEARLDWARARRTDPKWTPPFFADQCLAWEVPRPDGADDPLRVEAAVHQGKVVYFKVFHGPWDRPDPLDGLLPAEPKLFQYTYAAVYCLVLVGAGWLARRNLRLGLGDPAGASRLAVFLFACHLVCMALVADHVPSFRDEAVWLVKALGCAGLWSGLCWLLYVALEPYVRRRWPWRMVSWSRVLAGRFQDPMVGRDLQVGVLLGVFLTLLLQLGVVLPPLFGRPSPLPLFTWPTSFTNVPYHLLMPLPAAVRDGFQWFFLLFLLMLFVRSEWLAIPLNVCMVLLYYLIQEPEVHPFWVALMGVTVATSTFVVLRFGLLAQAIGLYFCYFLYQNPLTLDWGVWYGWHSLVYLLWPVVVAGVGFLIARGGQPPFREISLG
jgi:serine/threonine-protein kinase